MSASMRRIRSRSWLISSWRGVAGSWPSPAGRRRRGPVPGRPGAAAVELELGQVGRDAAEVAAAQASELVGAGRRGFDVGRLSADPERDRDLPDPHPGVLVSQQAADLDDDAVALVVELMRADPVEELQPGLAFR